MIVHATTPYDRTGPSGAPRSIFVLLAAVSLVTGTCTESTSPPPGSPGFSVVAGADQLDSALARLPQALVVLLRGADGRPAAGETVRFESVPSDSVPQAASVFVAPVSSSTFGVLATMATDGEGEAAALLQLGVIAGRGRVAVFAPRLGYRDTVTFTVVAGAPAQLVVTPADTAVYVGHSYALVGHVADAHGNRRTEPVEYRSLDSSVTVSALGQVTGAAFGRSAVVVTTAGLSLSDTVRASVVPQGRLAAVASASALFPTNAIVTMNLDGSGVAVLPQSTGENNYLQWNPAGSGLLLFRPNFNGHVYTLSLSGTLVPLVQSAGFAEDNWGRYAAGGSYVYFRAARVFAGPGYIWRIRPDGTGLDSVHVGQGTQPAPSPDGMRVAYVDSAGGLHVYDFGSAADSRLGFGGWAPHWSPDGSWIASDEGSNGLISVFRPDGTGRRALASAGSFDWSFDWSPDTQWLVGFDPGRASLLVVQVQTGLTVPLPFTFGLIDPTWKP